MRGENHDRLRYATLEAATLSPLPCWEHLSPEKQKQRVAEVVEEIEAEAAAERERTGITPPGPAVLRKQNPHDRPMRSKKSRAPLFHAASRRVRQDLYAAYHSFAVAFREAAEQLRAGRLPVTFPVGSFPPALPFVGG
jgi:hypothetical protein